MARSLNSFIELQLQLQPRGPLWDWLSSHPDEALRYQRYKAYAEEFRRVDQRREDLLTESLPGTINEKLEDWEQFLAITPAAGATDEQRNNAIIAKLFATGDQSVQFYQDLGLLLGHIITITKFKPLQFGDPFGSRWYSADWRWAWVVVTDYPTVNPEFEQTIRELVPAHIVLSFQYNGGL